MQPLYHLGDSSSPRFYTFYGVESMHLDPSALLYDSSNQAMTVQDLLNSSTAQEEAQRREYHLSNGRETMGHYTFPYLQENPSLLQGVELIWTEGYNEWMRPDFFPEIGVLLEAKKEISKNANEIASAESSCGRQAPPPIPSGEINRDARGDRSYHSGNEEENTNSSFAKSQENRIPPLPIGIHRRSLWEHFTNSLFNKYAQFKGRGSVREFWGFFLFYYLFFFLLISMSSFLFDFAREISVFSIFSSGSPEISFSFFDFPYLFSIYPEANAAVITIAKLVTFVPFLAATVRRIKDVNLSPWYAVLLLIPLANLVLLLAVLTRKGDPSPNRFGPVPVQ